MSTKYFFALSVALAAAIISSTTPNATAAIAQEAYLKAPNTPYRPPGGGIGFAHSVGMSGDTIVVGANGDSSNASGVNGNARNASLEGSGAAHVFVRNGTNWTQQAYLKASNPDAWDLFGQSVAISGDTIVVGADFEDSSATGVDGDQYDNNSIYAGAAYVFVRDGTNWSQQAYLKASNTDRQVMFGLHVAISGDTVVVGTENESNNATGVNGDQSGPSSPDPPDPGSARFSGAAYVFVREGRTWSQQAYLKASNAEAGDGFGGSVAISGDTVVVGAPGESSNATGVNGNQDDNSALGAGAAYVFVRNGMDWTQQAYLKASNTGGVPDGGLSLFYGDNFGCSVSISGDTIVVGAVGEASNSTEVNGDQSDNGARNSGAAYVFVRNGTNWTQEAYLKASNTDPGDAFGNSVAVSGDTIVVGAEYESSNASGVNGDQVVNSATNSGAAYVFVRSGTNWSRTAYLKASNTDAGDLFGSSVALSDDTVLVGANAEASLATGVNGNQSNNSVRYSGAAYVFAGLSLPPQLTLARHAQKVVLSWPAGATNYILEATTLMPTSSWEAVTNTPTVGATEIGVQLPLAENSQFFRLRKQ